MVSMNYPSSHHLPLGPTLFPAVPHLRPHHLFRTTYKYSVSIKTITIMRPPTERAPLGVVSDRGTTRTSITYQPFGEITHYFQASILQPGD